MAVILVNLIYLNPASNGGLSRVAKEMSLVLCDMADKNRHIHPVFAVNTAFAEEFPTWLGRKTRVIPVEPNKPQRPALRGLNADIIISPLFGVDPLQHVAELRGIKHIAMMPDALALDISELFSDVSHLFEGRWESYEVLKNVDVILTLSEFSKERLVHHLNVDNDRIIPIHLGSDLLSTMPPSDFGVEDLRPFLFYPANVWPHKRHELAIATFAQVLSKQPDMKLVLTGGRFSDFGVDILELSQKYELNPSQLVDLGYVKDEMLTQLYSSAHALLFTSRYEGFGMPIVEAMRLECPVVCAPVASIPEIASDAALYVDSEDPKEWAHTILNELPKKRDNLIQRGKTQAAKFSWHKTRENYHKLLTDVAPEIFSHPKDSVPMVSLVNALRESKLLDKKFVAEPQHFNAIEQDSAELSTYEVFAILERLDALTAPHKRSIVSSVPVIGHFYRFFSSAYRINQFWQEISLLIYQLATRQYKLETHFVGKNSTSQESAHDLD